MFELLILGIARIFLKPPGGKIWIFGTPQKIDFFEILNFLTLFFGFLRHQRGPCSLYMVFSVSLLLNKPNKGDISSKNLHFEFFPSQSEPKKVQVML